MNPMILLGGQAAGAAAEAVGGVFEAIGQRAALRSQARIAELNALTSDQAARLSRARGNFEETKSRMAYGNVKSKQRVGMGANYVALDEGSALDTQVTTDYISEVDAENIQRNAVYEAHGYQTAATGLRMGATMNRAQASGISPFMAGVQGVLTGAGKVAGSWYALDKYGAFNQKPGGTTTAPSTGRGGEGYWNPNDIGSGGQGNRPYILGGRGPVPYFRYGLGDD